MSSKQYQQRLQAALESGDLAYLRSIGPPDKSMNVVEAAMHKMRVDHTKVSAAKRWESVEWLRERGLRRMNGMELPESGGELPA